MVNPTPLNDPLRLRTLREAVLLDTPAERAFDRLTGLATRILDAPVSLVSLVDEDRQFFKSCVGLPEPWASERETPLSHSFCQHTVTTGEPLLIDDARDHPLVRDNLAIRDLNVIAYAGIPLELDGQMLGSFCVIDSEPRRWHDREVDILRALAESVMVEIELRVTARELEQTAHEREEVLRIVSHDLRNPLGLVASSAELLDYPDLDDDLRNEHIAIIRRAADRMIRLTTDLLDLARLDAGALRLEKAPVPLSALLHDAARAASTTTEKAVPVETDAPDDEVSIPADENRLHQALGNLLGNALRVTPENGRVVLRGEIVPATETPEETPATDGPEPIARITVEDTGPGIPPDQLPRIFDRYYQGDDDARGSAGLGLAIVRAIAEAHGGTVRAESEAGRGARLILELPAGPGTNV